MRTVEDAPRPELLDTPNMAAEVWGVLLEPPREPAFFALVTVEHGTVEWPNGLGLDLVLLGLEVPEYSPHPTFHPTFHPTSAVTPWQRLNWGADEDPGHSIDRHQPAAQDYDF